jgi:ATP-dependent protease HslVU (ClpYQ) peptidase subunit
VTTVVASVADGLMVADSNICDDDRRYPGKKVWRIKGVLIGFAGEEADHLRFLEWYRGGMEGRIQFGASKALILSPGKLELFDSNYERPVLIPKGRDAIGTGAKAAMCAWEALGWKNPKRAVQIVCRHDVGSLGPVRVYRLR